MAEKVVKMIKRGASAATSVSSAADEKPKAKKEKKESIHRGTRTGMRVTEYLVDSLKRNFKKKLTDEQLLEDWRTEFPSSRGLLFSGPESKALSILHAVRNRYNAGKLIADQETPEKPLFAFDESGNKLPPPKRGRSAKAEEEEEVIVEEKPKKTKK